MLTLGDFTKGNNSQPPTIWQNKNFTATFNKRPGQIFSKKQPLRHSSSTQCFGHCTKTSLWFYKTQDNIYKAVLTDVE